MEIQKQREVQIRRCGFEGIAGISCVTLRCLQQQDLADKLNVVRQTISKWEQDLSVPDSDLLIALSEALETPVSILLGETVMESEADAVKALYEKLEIVNLQFARRKALRRRVLHWSPIVFCVVIAAVSAALVVVNSPYLGWDFSDPEIAVVGTAFHAFEWLFVRVAPMLLIAAIAGVCLTPKKACIRCFLKGRSRQ